MKTRKALSLLLAVCLVSTQFATAVLAETVPAESAVKTETADGQAPEETGIREEETDRTATPSAAKKADILLEAVAEDGMKVTLTADADAFEQAEELSLEVTPVSEKIAEKAAEELEEKTKSDNIARRVTYDIRVMQDGKEVQPVAGKKVRVEFTMSGIPSGADAVSVYHHVKEVEKAETIVDNVPVNGDKKESADASEENAAEAVAEADQSEGQEATVGGVTESFSLYTVDFTYNEKTVSLPGDTDHNRLADLLAEIGITEAIEDAKACLDAECREPAADGIVADAEGNVLFQVYEEGSEWYADALSPFSTEHGLLVKTENAEYKIRVTDDAAANVFRYNVKYIDENGVLQNCVKATVVDNTMKGEWPAGWYVAVDSVTMKEASVTVSGEVHLILADGCNLKVTGKNSKAGIRVSGSTNSLTIYGQPAGTGALNAKGDYACAGIGGGRSETGENIIINGGTVTATGIEGAGIGGGKNGEGKNITINGGNVTAAGDAGAYSANGGAGIGGGQNGAGKNITINGGTVTATSAEYGAGIGGGRGQNGTDIIINGGIVSAKGGNNGAGIGGGGNGNGGGEGNNITINGGTVTATGGNYGAGIGGGYTGKGNGIRIYGGIVTATAGNSATGIGGGSSYGGGGATACYYIYASKAVVVKAGPSDPPTSEIIPGHDINTQLGFYLCNNRYVTAILASTAVTLDPNGGTAGTKTEIEAALGNDMPALSSSELPTPLAAGQVFTGFFDAAAGGDMYYRPDGKSARRWDKKDTTSYTLYAHWAAPADISNATIDDIPSQAYTGSAITPEVTVRYGDGGPVLEPDTDYTVSYSNNTNAGTAVVMVSGKGIYTGSKEASFTIEARSIADAQISGVPSSSVYNGQAQTPVPAVSVGGKVLTSGVDYTLTYTNNKDAGSASVTVTGKGNYAGEAAAAFTIEKAKLTLTSDSAAKVYDGTPLTRKHVSAAGFTAGEGAAYTVTGSQTEVGSSKNTFTYTMNSGTKESNYKITKIEGDLIVAAVQKCIVCFDVQGHGTAPSAAAVRKGEKLAKPADPVETGYVFEGWYRESECITKWNFAEDAVSTDMILYAKWTDRMFTVNYLTQGHGTAPASMQVREGSRIEKPADPSETGYTFAGWFRDPECSNKWNFDSDKVTENTVLYAKWTDKLYTVTFDAQGYGTAPAPQTVREGDKLTKPEDPVYTGKDVKFAGWFRDSACTVLWDFAYDTVTEDMTLYAWWIPYDYLLITANSAEKIYDGTALTDSGYSESGLAKGDILFVTVEGSITDAGETENRVTGVSVRREGGNVTDQYHIVTMPGVLTVSKKKLTVTGTTVKDKLYDGTNDAVIDEPGTVAGIAGIDAGKVTVSRTAVFLSKDAGADVKALVEYQIDGDRAYNYERPDSRELKGAIGKRSVVMTSGSATKVYDETPLTNKNVTSVGFIAGEGAAYTVTGSQTEVGTSKNTFFYTLNPGTKEGNYEISKIEGNLTVTKAGEYTVSFDANGHGTAPGPQTVRKGAKLRKPSDPVYTGKDVKFAGWFKDPACTELWDFAYDIVTEDMTLYAWWIPYDYLLITANSAEKTYDSTALSDPGYKESGLVKGDILIVTVEGRITDAGELENRVTGVSVRREGGNVTDQYHIVTMSGVLKINRRNVVMTSASAQKVYDGKPLTADKVTVSGDGFVSGQGADFRVTGSQTQAGSGKNTFTYLLHSGTDPDNYTIRKEEGTLIVWAAPEEDDDPFYTTDMGTGTWNRPATGTWTHHADGTWGFGNRGISRFASTWGYIVHAGSKLSDWYYFGADGKMLTGFRTIGGKTYYFREVKDNREGAMETGFQTIGGKTYYFDTQRNSGGGAMATGWKIINGKAYYFRADGVLETP